MVGEKEEEGQQEQEVIPEEIEEIRNKAIETGSITKEEANRLGLVYREVYAVDRGPNGFCPPGQIDIEYSVPGIRGKLRERLEENDTIKINKGIPMTHATRIQVQRLHSNSL